MSNTASGPPKVNVISQVGGSLAKWYPSKLLQESYKDHFGKTWSDVAFEKVSFLPNPMTASLLDPSDYVDSILGSLSDPKFQVGEDWLNRILIGFVFHDPVIPANAQSSGEIHNCTDHR